MKLQSIVLFSAVAALATACGGPTYKATLTSANEVPSNTSTATGSVTATLDGTKLDVTGNYAGLTGAATAAHLHGPAAAGATAGPVCTLQFNESATAGTGTLSGECPNIVIADLNGGMLYANVHTATNQGGEIRGQLVKQ